MNILIVEGAYKGCEATTFTKGGVHYFKDDINNSDILLSNHLYIQKDGCLIDVINILNIAWGSDNLDFFLKAVKKDMNKIKNPNLLRKSRIEKFYLHNVEIENKLLESLKDEKEEQVVFNTLMTFVQDMQ